MLASMRNLIRIQRYRTAYLFPVLYFATLLMCGCTAMSTQVLPADSGDLFAKYSVKTSFKGRPASPAFTDPGTRLYRTRIREGVAKGVVFAGHYEVAVWGCGAGCISFAIIDAFTGKVSFFPASVSQVREAGERLTYRRDSRAIHIIGSLNEEDSADRGDVWSGKEIDLVSQNPAVLLDDDGSPIRP